MATQHIIVGSPEPVWVLDDTNPPGLNVDNPETRMAFDDTVNEICRAVVELPAIYVGSLVLRGKLTCVDAQTATKVCKVSVEVDAKDAAEDIGTETFDTANTTEITVNNTAETQVDWSLTLSNDDSAAAGDRLVLRLKRDNSTTGTNAVGDVIIEPHVLEYSDS